MRGASYNTQVYSYKRGLYYISIDRKGGGVYYEMGGAWINLNIIIKHKTVIHSSTQQSV